MTDIPSRLSRCFLAVFPGLTEAALPDASQASLARWDSVAHVTLLAAISEEFHIELDEDSFEALGSYAQLAAYVEAHVRHDQ